MIDYLRFSLLSLRYENVIKTVKRRGLMEMFEVVDVGVDFMGDVVEVPAVNEAVKLRIDDACIECKRCFGRVDLQWIANSAKVSQEKIISELRGTAIFQDPELLIDKTEWDAFFGWEFAEQYLCGNIAKKLEIALEMEKRFPNCFRENVEKLKKLLPEKVMFNEINTPFGANWVPSEVYVEFFKTLFNVRGKIMLHYIVGLSKWKVLGDSGILNSLPNLVTYGTDRIDAVHIIEKTMNAASVKIYDYVNCNPTSSASNKRIPNKRATLEAQEKQRLIVDRWNNWLQANVNAQKIIQESYNDQFVGYAYSPFDGSFLTFDDLNPEIKLYKHQKDAVARALLSSNNLLLAHEVGSGKTYEMIVIAHESKRMGISNKNMIVLPNNVLGDAINAHKFLYPNDRILTVFPKDFAPAYRNKVLKEIRDGDYVAIYMACSSFDMVKMSKQWWMNHKHNEIKDLKNAALNSVDKIEKRALKSKIQALEKSLEKYIRDGRDTPWMCFDELGVTTLMVDEAHHYKNISFDTRCDGIVGIHKSGSKKANEMMAKCHYEGVKKVIFSTGTPLTNSIADLYVFQKFLQPNELKVHGLNTFDSWINTFATREESVEIDIDSSTLRTMVRFSKFHNLTELMSLFSSVCDFHFNDEENGLPKWNGYIDVSSEKTPFQSEYISELMLRTEDLRKGKISKSEDNALKICSDGRKSALDDRLVSEEACNYHYEFRKVNKCANIIKEFYDKFPNTAQVVFSDIGTPKAEFNIYDSLKSELENLGIPSFEIAFIHDATSEKQRKLLFKQINSGVVRVIIGSTSKLGIGTNFQERLICAHHLSIPWRPSDVGRILRTFKIKKNVEVTDNGKIII